jgi:hypothetical protein
MGCLANASKAASGTGVGPGIISINLLSMVFVLVENFSTIQYNFTAAECENTKNDPLKSSVGFATPYFLALHV